MERIIRVKLLLILLVLLYCLSPAAADFADSWGDDLINPGFETGDLTGWFGYRSIFSRVWLESASGPSEGIYCFNVTYDPTFAPLPGPGLYNWDSGLMQNVALEPWQDTFSIDIRSDEDCTASVTLVEMGEAGPLGDPIDILAGTTSSAPNGFTRYTTDVGDLAGRLVRLDINLSGPSGDPSVVSVDNVQIIPDPCTLVLLGAGSLAMIAPHKRRR